MIDLRCGDWRDVLGDVECDALICDPPYSARTDKGYRSATDYKEIVAFERKDRVRKNKRKVSTGGPISAGRFELPYAPITEEWARAFVESWATRARDWMVIFGDHVSHAWFESAMSACGLITFAPVPWVRTDSAPRFNADGPASSCEWIAIGRHKGLPRVRLSRPGFYLGTIHDEKIVTGGKPLWLMRAIVRDYSRPGDIVCDPCAGGATTLLAAAMEGRCAVGAEMDPATYAKAMKRVARGYTPLLPGMERKPVQQPLALEQLSADDGAEGT